MNNLKSISSYKELNENVKGTKRAYLLLYKEGSDQSSCAFDNLTKIAEHFDDIEVMSADVSKVRDIHEKYGITSAPTLIEFVAGEYHKTVKGCHKPDFYKTVIENKAFTASGDGGKPAKRVTVYSTSSCPHCNTLKDYLRKMNIRFVDIDVSKDQQKARELVKRTGQQGVPQTDINGKFVVGFDKNRINQLLEIQG